MDRSSIQWVSSHATEGVANRGTANFDFTRHYRLRVNVVERPITGAGRGFDFIGHREVQLPLLAAAFLETADS